MQQNGEFIMFLVTFVVFAVGSDLGTFFERKLSQSIIDNNAPLIPPVHDIYINIRKSKPKHIYNIY